MGDVFLRVGMITANLDLIEYGVDMEIKSKEDALKLEGDLAEHLKKVKEKHFANGVPWSYESDDGKGMIREHADGRKEFIPYD